MNGMKSMKKLLKKRFLAGVLSLSMILGMVPVTPVTAHAEEEKTITGLGTGAIGNPLEPQSIEDHWSGSFVYFGKYDDREVRYRVLQKSTNEFGADTLFLDCNDILYTDAFSGSYSDQWAESDVRQGLNGADFYDHPGCFTEAEKAAIHESTVSANDDYVGLDNDRIFLLDDKDVNNKKYGYIVTHSQISCNATIKRSYDDYYKWWLLRTSTYMAYNTGVSCIYHHGYLGAISVSNTIGGICPAFNVKLSSILFSSLVSGNAAQPGAEYKLTLLDDDLKIKLTDGEEALRSGTTVMVPYTVSGTHSEDANRVSVLITESKYTPGTATTEGYDYLKLDEGDLASSGEGTFVLPDKYDGKVWGTDYHVYLLAEDVNGEKETDYASEPVELAAPTPMNMEITAQPQDKSLTYGYGSGETLEVTANDKDGNTLLYQWYSNTKNSNKGGTAIVGADQPVYTIPAGMKPGEKYYYCVVTHENTTIELKSKAAGVSVSKKPITVSGIKVKTKNYDGTTDAELDFSEVILDGKVGEDDLSVTANGEFDDPAEGYDKLVYITGLTLIGSDVDNYVLADSGQQTTAEGAIATVPATVTKLPKAIKGLVYNGKPQALAEPGEVISGNTLWYAATESAEQPPEFDPEVPEAERKWHTTVPEETDAGTYYLWFKVEGDPVSANRVGPINIEKAEYDGIKTVSVNVAYYNAAENMPLALPEPPEGAKYAASGTVSGDEAFITSHSVKGNTLVFSTGVQESQKKAYISVPVNGLKNYKDYSVTAVIETKADADVSIAGGDRRVTAGSDDFTLSCNAALPGEGDGHWSFKSSDPEKAVVSDKGVVKVKAAGTVIISAEYESDTNCGKTQITLTIDKIASKITEEPEAIEGLEYKKEEQVLIRQGQATGGVMQYKLGSKGVYSEELPKAVEAGDYTVYYRVSGNEIYQGTEEKSITVNVAGRKATVKADDKTMIRGENDPEFTVSINGVLTGDSVSYDGITREKGSEPGNYAITPYGKKEQGSYIVSFVPGVLTIKEKSDDSSSGNNKDSSSDSSGKDSSSSDSGKDSSSSDSSAKDSSSSDSSAKDSSSDSSAKEGSSSESSDKDSSSSDSSGKDSSSSDSSKESGSSSAKDETGSSSSKQGEDKPADSKEEQEAAGRTQKNKAKLAELSKLIGGSGTGTVNGLYQTPYDTVSVDIIVTGGNISGMILDEGSIREGENFLTLNTGTRILLGEAFTVSNNFADPKIYKKASKFVKKKKDGYSLDLKPLKSSKGGSYQLILTGDKKVLIIDVVDVSLNKKGLKNITLSTAVKEADVIANAVSENEVGEFGFAENKGVLTISTRPSVKDGIPGRGNRTARFTTGVWNVAGVKVMSGSPQLIMKGNVKVLAMVKDDGTLAIAKAGGSGKGSVSIDYTLNGKSKRSRSGIKFKAKVYKAKVKIL